MDQLNAAYNNMSIYGDSYGVDGNKTQIDNSSGINNIDLTSAPINNIQPYLPIINQGGDQGGDNDIFKSYYKYNDDKDPFFKTRENKTGPGLLSLLKDKYMQYGIIPNILKAGKTGIETAQDWYAKKKEKDLMAEIQAANLAAAQKAEQATLANQLATAQKEIEARGYQDYGQGAASQSTQDSYQDSGGGYAGASTQDYGGGEKDGGYIDGTNRRRYGTGGIVTL